MGRGAESLVRQLSSVDVRIMYQNGNIPNVTELTEMVRQYINGCLEVKSGGKKPERLHHHDQEIGQVRSGKQQYHNCGCF